MNSKNNYLRQVLFLISGSLLGQIVTLIFMPFLTRLYTPDAFGKLGLILAMVSVVSPGVAGRFDAAIVIVKSNIEKKNLIVISVWMVFVVTITSCLVQIIVIKYYNNSYIIENIYFHIIAFSALLFVTGIIEILKSVANSTENYKIIGGIAIIQNMVIGFSSIGFAFSGMDGIGLIISNIFGGIFSLLLLCRLMTIPENIDWKINAEKIQIAKKYKDFPYFNAPSSILNGLMSGLPIFFIANYFGESIVGQYALLLKVGVAPLSVIGEAVSRVNFKKISNQINSNINPIPLFIKTTIALVVISIVPGFILILVAPELFTFLFGDKWKFAGELLIILMPALMLQFIVSSLSMSFVAAGHLRLLAAWQLFSFLTTIFVFYFIAPKDNLIDFFKIFMIKELFVYSIYYISMCYALNYPIKK